jgi:TonB family protein
MLWISFSIFWSLPMTSRALWLAVIVVAQVWTVPVVAALPHGNARTARLVHGADAPCPAGTEGLKHVVALDVEIGADGTVGEIARMNAEASPLDDAAIAAVRQSTFSPAVVKRDGAPMRRDVFVVFRGNGQPGQVKEAASQPPIPRVQAEAEFSAMGRAQGVQGEVMLRQLVTEKGEPADIQVLKHLPAGMDEEAVKAARKYRFSPAN